MAFEPAWKKEVRIANEIAAQIRAQEKPSYPKREKCIVTDRKYTYKRMERPLALVIPETQAAIENMAREIKTR